jgi:hypothetical protein
MEERDLNPFLDAFGEQEATEPEQQEEERSVASSLFAKIRAALAGGAGGELAGQSEAESPEQLGSEDEDMTALQDFSGGEPEPEQAEEEQSRPAFPQPTDEEIQQAAKAVTQAIRDASNMLGVELSDDKVLMYALTVLGQAASLEQAELLAYGLLAREAQRQGVGVRANRTREFEHGKRDTLEEFIEMVSR